MGWLRNLWERLNSSPRELSGEVATETWPCPECGNDVEVETTPMAMRNEGWYSPPSRYELRRLFGFLDSSLSLSLLNESRLSALTAVAITVHRALETLAPAPVNRLGPMPEDPIE